MDNQLNNINHDNEIIKELLHSLQVLKRAKTEYEKSDIDLEVLMWNELDTEFQDLFSKYNNQYYVMKNFLKEIEKNKLNDFFDIISPEKNIAYIKKFVTYKEMLNDLSKNDEQQHEQKTKI